MITNAQVEAYRNGQQIEEEENGGQEWRPPRVIDSARTEDDSNGQTLLLVGFPNPELADCECGEDHVLYLYISEDGMYGTDPMTGTFFASGTFGEMMTIPEDHQWANALEVTPEEWPAESVDVQVTDMTEFEF